MKKPQRFPREPEWFSAFHSVEDFKNAPPITYAIEGFLQNDAATLIGGLSEHGKTLILLSMVKALLAGPDRKLWGHFKVSEKASRVIYLIPESGITPFKHRLKRFHLSRYVEDGRLLIRTLSKGPAPRLDDPKILEAAKGAHVFLDTDIRFGEGEENVASDNQQGLAKYIFGLFAAGARTVVGAHHAPKSFAAQNTLTLENILRGSGDIGALVATAWGVRQLEKERNVLHLENIKARDFQPCGPFQIVGRPYIDREGDFRMHRKPGECGSLAQELRSSANKGGAPKSKDRSIKLELTAGWVAKQPKITSTELVRKFRKRGYKVAPQTARKYRAEALKQR